MRLFDVTAYALGSLDGNRVRTVLMLIAMAIGVAAVVLLTGIGNGAKGYIVDQFSSLGTNLVIVIPGRSDTAGNTAATLVGETPRDLTLGDARALTRHETVRMLAPINMGEMHIAWGGRERQVPLIGGTAPLLDLLHLKMERGSFLPEEDMELSRPVCVLGAKVERELFGRQNGLGELVRLGGFRCRVVGVLASEGRSLGLDTQELVIVPVAFAQTLLDTEGLFRIFLETRDLSMVERMKSHIRTTIAKRHYGEDDVTIITQDSVLATFDKIFNVLTLTVAAIAGISLIVAGILVMNVMLMAVTQRTAEIGLLKALGAGRAQIMALLISEALVLSAIGAFIGLILGFAGAWLAVQIYPNLDATPPTWAILAAVGTALGTGFLSSLVPARRAAGLDPIQALARR